MRAYNEISTDSFSVPMQKRAGKWVTDIRDVAEHLDAERAATVAAHNNRYPNSITNNWSARSCTPV
ncbi:hypothetical protein [Paraburkholderia fynbosensis]|uniref:Uncharacterized protein n=1 Tax=Paraburkholderia fynbosensis TaxID=1200993 RepID=A0A6J5FL13_9BURK|nr:hypothetical protein [Paraburkholderia fynbosensis]CAB3782174.1 hypothetical protein LMG27177_01183 [Paraburkholderia fynbosensis]